MEHTFRNAMLRLAGGDLIGGDTKGAEMWLAQTQPDGGQPWHLPDSDGCWNIVVEWRGENVHVSFGDFGGGFSGIVKPTLESEEDEML